MVLAATAAPNNFEVGRLFLFLVSFGFSFLSLPSRGGEGRERVATDCRSGGGEGAPVHAHRHGAG
jgi:hypothetical protein